MTEEHLEDDAVFDDGIDEANPPEDEVDPYPDDVEEQNLAEGEEPPDDPEFHPDLPDVDDDEFVAEIEKGAEDDA
jgi:hypothetical protein